MQHLCSKLHISAQKEALQVAIVCIEGQQHMHVFYNRLCQYHMQGRDVFHLAIRNRDGISYNTAIYKDSETTLLMLTKHSPEARQLNFCCPSCCPTRHASSSSCFQWHTPVPTTARCAFHIQIDAQRVLGCTCACCMLSLCGTPAMSQPLAMHAYNMNWKQQGQSMHMQAGNVIGAG